MLAAMDARRFVRVQRTIRLIVNLPLRYGAKYWTFGKVCDVDLSQLPFRSKPTLAMHHYVCTLVHEATHGHVERFRLPYVKRTRVRIERLCVLEAWRFAMRLDAGLCDWDRYFRAELELINRGSAPHY